VGVVVRGRQLDEDAKLGLGLLPATKAEIRDPERLSNRAGARLAALGLLERDGRLGRHAVAEMRAPALEELVRIAHSPTSVGL